MRCDNNADCPERRRHFSAARWSSSRGSLASRSFSIDARFTINGFELRTSSSAFRSLLRQPPLAGIHDSGRSLRKPRSVLPYLQRRTYLRHSFRRHISRPCIDVPRASLRRALARREYPYSSLQKENVQSARRRDVPSSLPRLHGLRSRRVSCFRVLPSTCHAYAAGGLFAVVVSVEERRGRGAPRNRRRSTPHCTRRRRGGHGEPMIDERHSGGSKIELGQSNRPKQRNAPLPKAFRGPSGCLPGRFSTSTSPGCELLHAYVQNATVGSSIR